MSSLAADLHSIHMYTLDGLEARLRLEKLISVHCNSAWAASLALILHRQASDERAFAPEFDQMVQGVRCNDDHPLVGFALSGLNSATHYLDSLEGWDSSHPSVIYCHELLMPKDGPSLIQAEAETGQLSALKCVFTLARQSNYIAAAELISSFKTPVDSDLLRKDLSVVAVKLLLLGGDIAGAVAKATNCFLEFRYYSAILPIQQLVSGILLEHDEPLHASATRGKMNTAIMFDIHSRYISSEHDVERADAFNDLLKKEVVSHASKLPLECDSHTAIELRYFLQYVAIPNVLDQCLDLRSTKEVEEERVAILLKLDEVVEHLGEPEVEIIKEELRDIRTKQVVRETARKLDESKIYVNIEAIRRSVDVTLKETWNRYHLVSQNSTEAKVELIEHIIMSASGDHIRIVKFNAPSTTRSELFHQMVHELGEQFTTNKEFGLNANLSTNIRHGYVLRELRSPLVSLRIVTNKDSDSGSYFENTHWDERLLGLNANQKTKVQQALAEFSQKIDGHIDDLNRHKLRVKSTKNVEGLFVYDLTKRSIDQMFFMFSRVKVKDYEEFVSMVFSVFWGATEDSLDNVRRHLNDVVLVDLHLAVDKLENELTSIASSDQLTDLVSLLPNAKIELRHAVERVSSWFALSRDHEYQDYDLKTAFDVGLRTVESYYSDIQIIPSFSSNEQHLMKGSTLPFFARLFDMLLDNAGKHGAEGNSKLVVSAEAIWDKETLMLTVANTLKDNHDLEKLKRRIDQINSEYGKEAAKDLVGEEGGSGYPKIWKILRRDLGLNHDLGVSLEEHRFHVKILIERGAKL